MAILDIVIQYIIPLTVLTLSIVTVIVSATATRRFLKGELKQVLQWLMPVSLSFFFTCFFLGVVFVLMTMSILDVEMTRVIQYLILFEGVFLILTSIFFIKVALALYKFSEVYGFAEMPQVVVKDSYEQLADAIVRGATAVAGANAVKYASELTELKVAPNGSVAITKPEKLAAVKKLIEKYKAVIGPTVLDTLKKEAKPVLGKYPKIRDEFSELA